MQRKYKRFREKVVEVVTPFGGKEHEAAVDGLFDDCPVCLELRRQLQTGEAEAMDGEE